MQISDLSGRLLWQQEFVDQLSWTPENEETNVFLVSIWKDGQLQATQKVIRQ